MCARKGVFLDKRRKWNGCRDETGSASLWPPVLCLLLEIAVAGMSYMTDREELYQGVGSSIGRWTMYIPTMNCGLFGNVECKYLVVPDRTGQVGGKESGSVSRRRSRKWMGSPCRKKDWDIWSMLEGRKDVVLQL